MNKDITLPYELSTKDLSLKEIGTIFTMFAIQKMTNDEASKWGSNDEYLETVEDLLSKEYMKVTYDKDENMSLEIDLTDKEPAPFWELYEYDDSDNPIYEHPSHYGDDGSPFYYRIKPVLIDMKVVWVDCSDADLDYVDEYFDSLEEAEEYYKELLEEQLKNIKKDGWKR